MSISERAGLDAERIRTIQTRLIDWYLKNHRKLPWRETGDPYRIWVSEVMLQQTRVSTVLPYYRSFLKRFPTTEELASADLQTVLKIWEGMGYYARARNLHRAARQVVQEYGGTIPGDPELFGKLPGVGEYIASAVLSIAFDLPFAVVDGNVKRVLSRLFGIEEPVNQSSSYKRFKATAQVLLMSKRPGTFNQAVMELGAMICKPRQPICDACPLSSACTAYQQNRVDQYPKRIQRPKTPEYRMAVGIVNKDGRLLITQRKPDGLLGGLWEFPGGRINEENTAEEACVKRVKEAVNLTIEVQEHMIRVRHAYTHFKIVMDVFRCRYAGGRVKLSSAVGYRWILPKEIDAYPFHRANHKFIRLLRPSM